MNIITALKAVSALLVIGSVAQAASVAWKGLTWTIAGTNTTAVVDTNGYLDITVVGGQSNDPEPDNWVLESALPANLTQANAPWVEFTFQEVHDFSDPGGGPRGFVDTYATNGGTEFETMLQGGILEDYSHYYLNHDVWNYSLEDWVADNWWTGPARTTGLHTVEFGMLTTGNIDMLFDGVVRMTIPASSTETFFQQMYLGVSALEGTTVTGTYTDLKYGTGYQTPTPEPASVISLLGGLGCLIAFRRRVSSRNS
jgi:hypothetical protein